MLRARLPTLTRVAPPSVTLDHRRSKEEEEIDWVRQLPIAKELKPERILDKKLLNKTRGQEYFQYLVKWKDQPIVEATLMTDSMLQKLSSSVEESWTRAHEEFCPHEFDAGA